MSEQVLDSPWTAYYNYILTTKVFIAVGLSGDDQALRSSIAQAKKMAGNSRKTLGFWFARSGSITPANRILLRNASVAIIEFDTHQKSADFLIDIAMGAAGNIII